MKIIPFIILALLTQFGSIAQNKVDVRLNQVSLETKQSCYSIDMRSPYGEAIDLAGQNYRVFYDAAKAELIKESIDVKLSEKSYSKVDIINTTQNDIGFLSLSIDGRKHNDQTMTIDHKGNWSEIATVCFDHTSSDYFDLIWADEKTENFASATVALSEWVDEENQNVLLANTLINHIVNNDVASVVGFEMNVFPNPVVDFVQIDILKMEEKEMNLIIKDVIGREVAFENVIGPANLSYNLTNWPSGRYTVELISKNGNTVYTESIVKADTAH